MTLVSMIQMLLMVLVSMSFFTLLERKVLSYSQSRKGPNKTGLMGLLQPFSDAVKLFSKESFKLVLSVPLYYTLCPMIMLMVSLVSWLVVPMKFNLHSFELSMLFLFSSLSVMSYPIMVAGWSSSNIYSLLGAIRAVAQIISYEVSMMLICMSVLVLSESYDLKDVILFQTNTCYAMMMPPLVIMFFISILAELNRAPFDFIEGESELVSGFNTEYFGGGFSIMFMGEYCSILLQSYLMVVLFFGVETDSFMFLILHQLVIWLIILSRSVMPRMRYDELMYLCWKVFLPLSISMLMLAVSTKWIIMEMTS